MVGTARCAVRTPQRGVPTTVHRPEGDGLGGSRPDSIIVGRIGPIPSRFVLRGRAELLRSTGVSLFTGLGVAATVGFGAGAFSASGSRVLGDCELDCVFNPPAARTPAARISSSVRLAGADFFSRDFDFRGVGAGVSEGSSSEGWTACFGGSGVCLKGSGCFSRATITSCACIFPIRMTLQTNARNNALSKTPPDKRKNPFTSPHS
jgi:hypothetical protein